MLLMRRYKLLILILLFSNIAFCQNDPIKDATYHFTIKNNEFLGGGADTLKNYIRKAQFFLIGEEHNMKELQDFTTSILPLLKNCGYKNFALEIGPVSSEKISSIYLRKQTITDFNTKYYKYIDGSPFGFFDGKEEERFSNQAFKNGFKVWGLDFENYNAPLFILDQLYETSKKSNELNRLYELSHQAIIDEYAKDKIEKKYNLATNLLNSVPIKSFFEMVSTNSKAKYIIDQQILSWKIYDQESRKNWYPRVENMRENFMHNYNLELKKNKIPKVFVKMGAVHIAKGTSSSGFKEVGDLVHELAKTNGTKSFSVISFARYRINAKGELLDLLEDEDAQLLKYTTKDSWSLIDLNRLKKESQQGEFKLSKTMLSYIEKFDMMLIPPATKSMELNIHPYKNE